MQTAQLRWEGDHGEDGGSEKSLKRELRLRAVQLYLFYVTTVYCSAALWRTKWWMPGHVRYKSIIIYQYDALDIQKPDYIRKHTKLESRNTLFKLTLRIVHFHAKIISFQRIVAPIPQLIFTDRCNKFMKSLIHTDYNCNQGSQIRLSRQQN